MHSGDGRPAAHLFRLFGQTSGQWESGRRTQRSHDNFVNCANVSYRNVYWSIDRFNRRHRFSSSSRDIIWDYGWGCGGFGWDINGDCDWDISGDHGWDISGDHGWGCGGYIGGDYN